LSRQREFCVLSLPLPEGLDRALESIATRADAVFLREPAIDPNSPETSDLDLLAFGPVDGLLPERVFSSGSRPVDIIWLPAKSLDDPVAFAKQGLVPHRLLSSRVVYDPTASFERQARLVEGVAYEPPVQAGRIEGFLDLGFLTVREIGITWDFPPLALFWLHMAYAALVATLGDATRTLCPNVYSRPFDYAPRLEGLTGLGLVEPYLSALRLRPALSDLVDALRRVHHVVATRFPEPSWPDVVGSSTRYEYRYFLASQEVEWRIAAASEMARRGNAANAVFYLRLLAYSLARAPSVRRHALAGEDASFLRPRRAILPELSHLCPEIVPDLSLILGNGAAVEHVRSALELILGLRSEVLTLLESRALPLPPLREWAPFQKKSSVNSKEEDPIHDQDRRHL
jgi:hypothetical protein